MKSNKKTIHNLKKSIKKDNNSTEELIMIDSWEGKLLKDNYKIQIFTVKNKPKRKPIIKIISDDQYKNIQGPLLKLRLLPQVYREMPEYKNQNIYRLVFYYMTKGGYQGGPLHSYAESKVLFSLDMQSIKEIESMLSKYTNDIKKEYVSVLQDKWEGFIDDKKTIIKILKNPQKKDYQIKYEDYLDDDLDKFILGNEKYMELYQCPMKKIYQITILVKNKKYPKIIVKLDSLKDFQELETMLSKYIKIKKNIIDE